MCALGMCLEQSQVCTKELWKRNKRIKEILRLLHFSRIAGIIRTFFIIIIICISHAIGTHQCPIPHAPNPTDGTHSPRLNDDVTNLKSGVSYLGKI